MRRTTYALAVVMAAAGATGCATLEVNLENRLACTVAKDKLFVVSQYGPVGIASTVAEADRREVCK